MQSFAGSPAEWNELIATLPDPHLLQTWEWSRVKAAYGWEPLPLQWLDDSGSTSAAAVVLKKPVLRRGFAARLCVLYVPKGPLLDWRDESLVGAVLNDLQALARKHGAIFAKIDPDVVLGTGVPGSNDDLADPAGVRITAALKHLGWKYSSDQVQFRNTVVVDLSAPEEELLARMKQKTRYNVRLAEKKGVTVRVGSAVDLSLLYKMYAETSVRDGFVIRDENYYLTVWRTFMQSHWPRCEPLIAEVEGEAVAAIFLFMFAGRAYYIYGMSRDAHREKMPTYLLQWEAMRRARRAGCTSYDLWGAPEMFDESDSMWGVYRFKEGLGGRVVRTLGAWDFAPNPLWYTMYARVMPKVLEVMRARGRARTQESLG